MGYDPSCLRKRRLCTTRLAHKPLVQHVLLDSFVWTRLYHINYGGEPFGNPCNFSLSSYCSHLLCPTTIKTGFALRPCPSPTFLMDGRHKLFVSMLLWPLITAGLWTARLITSIFNRLRFAKGQHSVAYHGISAYQLQL